MSCRPTRQALPGIPIGHRQRAALEEIHGTGKARRSRGLVHVIQRDGRRPDGRRGQDVVCVKGRGELGFDAPLLGQGIKILACRHPLASQNARAHVLVQRQIRLVTEVPNHAIAFGSDDGPGALGELGKGQGQ